MRKCLGLGAALWLFSTAGWAVDWKSLKPLGYVSDFARVVDPASQARLETYGANLEAATGAEIALVTIPTLQGEPLKDVAQTIASAWGSGQKSQRTSILLLMVIHDRRSRLEIGQGLEPILPPSLNSSVMREMRPALRAQQYGEAMLAAAETLGIAVARAKHAHFNAALPRQMRPTLLDSFPWPFMLCAVFELGALALLITYSMRRAGGGRRAFQPGIAFRRSPSSVLPSGTQSGGGFGSFDSADSFGGFGGDDAARSGAGGPGSRASSDW